MLAVMLDTEIFDLIQSLLDQVVILDLTVCVCDCGSGCDSKLLTLTAVLLPKAVTFA